jgi:hypothetical protein
MAFEAQHPLLTWGRTAVASKEPRKPSGAGGGRRTPKPTLTLVRTEPAGSKGILLVYESHGGEHTWLLEQTSAMEIMALLMQGRFKDGRRVVLEADVALEPPDDSEPRPHLCFTAGPLENCVPIDRTALNALHRDIVRYLALPG